MKGKTSSQPLAQGFKVRQQKDFQPQSPLAARVPFAAPVPLASQVAYSSLTTLAYRTRKTENNIQLADCYGRL
jgi:hypothetical protein